MSPGYLHPPRLFRVPTSSHSSGKQASSVGGMTVHSVADVPRGKKNNNGLLDNTDGQKTLDPEKAARWFQAGVLAIEEFSMVSTLLHGCLHKAAASVRPSFAHLPYAGLISVSFGDLNQARTLCQNTCSLRMYSPLRFARRNTFD